MSFFYKWRWELSSPLAGACLTLAFAPFDYSYLVIVSLIFAFLSWLECSPNRAALRGFLYGFGLFACGISWVYISVHDYGGASALGALLLTVLIICFWSLFPALTAFISSKLFSSKYSNQYIFIFPSVWMFIEYFRGTWFINGFPWLQIAYTQLYSPLKGYIPIIGSYGTGFFLALTAAMLVAAYKKQIAYKLVLIYIVLIWGGGSVLQTVRWTKVIGEEINVALIQGNVAQDQKWLPENRLKTLLDYQHLTEQNWDADIIIWPESAIPAYLSQAKESYINPLSAQAKLHNTTLIVGLPALGKKNEHFNTVLALGKQEGRYNKNHLLPFGEYLPLQPASGFILKLLNISLGSFSSGGSEQKLLQAAGYPFATSICYEDAFASEALNTMPEAAFLVNVTNDAWFGDSLEPHQHMQIAQMRALETGRYMLRVTNTGITAIVAPDGLIDNRVPSFKQTVLKGSIFPMGGMTFYARLGDEVIMLVLAFFILLSIACSAIGIYKKKLMSENMKTHQPFIAIVPYDLRNVALGQINLTQLISATPAPQGKIKDLTDKDHIIIHPSAKIKRWCVNYVNLRCNVSLMLPEPMVVDRKYYKRLWFLRFKFHRIFVRYRALENKYKNIAIIPIVSCWIPPLKDSDFPQKNQLISIIASDKKRYIGHQLRHQIIQQVKLPELAVLGWGYVPLKEKKAGLLPYKFSIVIENCQETDYFTEKLVDSFACKTVPIYWGCPNISDYFDIKGMIIFNNIAELNAILADLKQTDYQQFLPFLAKNHQQALKLTDTIEFIRQKICTNKYQ
ncbi:MAG: apolipoprotein N-acyltransferase [Methylococcales symbiont of Hymedesmia sp. n. MRB-2018]|nr:MAG: apolipoprotein N-acyltransferase [Methylococcales symbiont of Hymedesmia sp. n. MRB-2018]